MLINFDQQVFCSEYSFNIESDELVRNSASATGKRNCVNVNVSKIFNCMRLVQDLFNLLVFLANVRTLSRSYACISAEAAEAMQS